MITFAIWVQNGKHNYFVHSSCFVINVKSIVGFLFVLCKNASLSQTNDSRMKYLRGLTNVARNNFCEKQKIKDKRIQFHTMVTVIIKFQAHVSYSQNSKPLSIRNKPTQSAK